MPSKGTQPYICMHPFSPKTSLPTRLPHNIEQTSLCYTVGPCWLSTLNTAVCTCQSQIFKSKGIQWWTPNHKWGEASCIREAWKTSMLVSASCLSSTLPGRADAHNQSFHRWCQLLFLNWQYTELLLCLEVDRTFHMWCWDGRGVKSFSNVSRG